MYYINTTDDLSYLHGQCDGEERDSGFPAWGTVSRANPAGESCRSAIADIDSIADLNLVKINLHLFRRILQANLAGPPLRT
ncbi:hypothetical protein L6452_29202 [Arctium lappa]|uniref:Uncharacterized protein n=1 Tax=Arctium lappa TaxID=4217 RepID=A0ACB8ZGT5_ARCLA|nr:hypothetical protein L6452_29202 [Arctium lappa]